jgi:hypothetical protein
MHLFYSYAHEDEELRQKLEKHLSFLKRQDLITGWHDRNISAGTDWAHEIDMHLNMADIILLLVSVDFLASDYCYSIEMERAFERYKSGEARVIPIILRPVELSGTPLSRLQALPTDGKPIKQWADIDEAFVNVSQGIQKVVAELRVTFDAPQGTASPLAPQPTTTQIPSNVFLYNQRLPSANEFFGRVREREGLLNRTRNGASTSIVGERRIGKTWLLSYLQLIAHKELGSRFLVGYLDVTASRCTTVARFAASAVETLTAQKHICPDGDEGLLVLEQVVEDLSASHQIPVLCVDEFEGFGNRQEFDLHFFSALRAMTQNGLCLVVASKKPLIEIVGEYGKTSGFFNVFKQCVLEPFVLKEARKFVQSKGDQAGLTVLERNKILSYGQVGGEHWPIRLQLVGDTLMEDKILALREQDPGYYRPEDQDYWQEFERRVENTYRGSVR